MKRTTIQVVSLRQSRVHSRVDAAVAARDPGHLKGSMFFRHPIPFLG